jgi:hypothetical protein
MLEEETKWQQLLQNKEVKGDKFFLFSRTIVVATRLHIKPCFSFIFFPFFFSYDSKNNLFSWVLFLLFLIGLVHIGHGFD